MGLEFSKSMAYKTNFIIKIFALVIADIMGPIVTTIIYSKTAGIPGWSFEQFLLLQGVFIFVMGAMHFTQTRIAWRTIVDVREGKFDRQLTKPYKPLTYLTLTSWDPEGIGEFAVGLAILGYSIAKLNIALFSVNFLEFLTIIGLALLFTYSLNVIVAALSFLVVKSFALFDLFFSVMDIARYPSTIYTYGMRFFVSFLIPVAVASTFPALALIKGYGLLDMLWIILPVLGFLIFALLLWGLAMKKYTSAGG